MKLGIGGMLQYRQQLSEAELNLHQLIEGNVSIDIMIYFLANNNCDLNFVYQGYAPVHKAFHMQTRNRDILLLLLERGADPNARDKRGNTLAHYAVEEDNIELLKLLQSKGADFNIKNSSGKTALDHTAEHNEFHREAYTFLSQFTKTNIGEKIVLAIKHQDLEGLKEHLAHLENKEEVLNTEPEKDGMIGHVACGIGNLKIIKLLEENRCNLLLPSSDDTTVLEEACEGDNADLNSKDRIPLITHLIKEVGVSITNQAIHNALYCSDIAIPKLLLEFGADSNALGENGYTPLLVLINQPRIKDKTLEVIKLLLKHGADILIHESHVGNSLHLAAERGHLEVARVILHYASEKGLLEQLLEVSPEECWVCCGMTAYQIATKHHHYHMLKLLGSYTTASVKNNLEELYSHGNYKEIIAIAAKDENSENNIEGLKKSYYYGKGYYALKKYPSAIKHFGKVIEVSKDLHDVDTLPEYFNEACYYKGHALYILKKYKGAINAFEEVPEGHHLFMHSCLYKGLCYEQYKSDFLNAAKCYKEAISSSRKLSDINQAEIKDNILKALVKNLITQDKIDELISFYEEQKISFSNFNNVGDSLLTYAVIYNSVPLVKHLLKLHINPLQKNYKGESAYTIAMDNGNTTITELLDNQRVLDVNMSDQFQHLSVTESYSSEVLGECKEDVNE